MAAFCHFYHYTPDEYRALTLRDFRELKEFRNKYLDAAAKKGRGR